MTARCASTGGRFCGMLAALGPDEVNRRFAAADRHLRDSGVFYRVYEDPAGAVRPWPLSHVPLLIDATEWQELQAGPHPARAPARSDPGRHLRPGQSRARRAACPPPWSPAIRNSCGRWSASRRPAARICGSTASTSAARPAGAGGCWATAPRRRPARASPWKIGWRCRARCRTSTARFASSASRRSSRRSRPRCPRSTAATIRRSAC